MRLFDPLKRIFGLFRNNLELLQETEELRNLLQVEIVQNEELRQNLATNKASLCTLADERDQLRASLKDTSQNAKIFSAMLDDATERALKAKSTAEQLNLQLAQRVFQLETVANLILDQNAYTKILQQIRGWGIAVPGTGTYPVAIAEEEEAQP